MVQLKVRTYVVRQGLPMCAIDKRDYAPWCLGRAPMVFTAYASISSRGTHLGGKVCTWPVVILSCFIHNNWVPLYVASYLPEPAHVALDIARDALVLSKAAISFLLGVLFRVDRFCVP
jgi:hypothetical protein